MAEKRIVFRVDGSKSLGLGHVVRSLNLAGSIKDAGGDAVNIHFVVIDDPGARRIIERSRFADSVTWLPSDGAHFPEFRRVLREVSPGMVVTDINLVGRVDEYLDLLYPGPVHVSLHEHNYPILSGDIVIAPTIRPIETGPGGTVGVTHFIGADYVLLSQDITELREVLIQAGSEPETGFISIGGGDPEGLTFAVLDALKDCDFQPVQWYVVLGPSSGYTSEQMKNRYSGPFEFIEGGTLQRSEFLERMAGSDLVITNGGTTLYESLALKRPTLAIPQNDFEEDVIDRLEKTGACTGVSKVSHQSVLKAVEGFIRSGDRMEKAGKAGDIIDGEGCRRVSKLILNRLM